MSTIFKVLEFIVPRALELSRLYAGSEELPINYACIFCQNDSEFTEFNKQASEAGTVVEETPTGPLYKFNKPLETVAGLLWLLKIRKPDSERQERGDADFTLKDYKTFKEEHMQDTNHFKLIERENFEMIELRDEKFPVLTYFSNIPLTVQLGIK